MALISSYATLSTAVADYLARSDLTSYIPNFIQNAEQRIYREMKLRQMETALSSTVSSGVVAVPSGFTALKFAYVDGSPTQPLRWVSVDALYKMFPTRSATGKPTHISREGSNFVFGPYPDSAYTIKGIYYKQLTALSDSNTTNWLTSDAPDLILFGALLEAAPFIQDDGRIAVWQGMYDRAASMLKAQDRLDFTGSRTMVSA